MFSAETWKEIEMPTKHRLYLGAQAGEEKERVCAMTSSLWWEIVEVSCWWAEPAEKGLRIQWSHFATTHKNVQSLIADKKHVWASKARIWLFPLLHAGINCEQYCHLQRSSNNIFSSIPGLKTSLLWINLDEKKHVLLLFWFVLVYEKTSIKSVANSEENVKWTTREVWSKWLQFSYAYITI